MVKEFKSWHSGLSKLGKVTLWSVTAVLAGSAINASANSSDSVNTPAGQPAIVQKVEPETKKPEIETKQITETEEMPFAKGSVNDSNLEKGKTAIRTAGSNGIKTLTYEVTYTDGVESGKKLVKEEITKSVVNELTAVGTYVAPKPVAQRQATNCDPNYSGCVPIASDVDCAGGRGDGPAYTGYTTVIGIDIYDLDRDGNGEACE